MVTEDASLKILGFTYQFERALYRILTCEHSSAVFGIETEDDVVEKITFEDGKVHILLEQDKHSVETSGQPYQDSSKNLWHTIHIWLEAMKETRETYSQATYCLVTNKKVGEKTLATMLSEASSEEEVSSAISELRSHATSLGDKVKIIAEQALAYPEDDLKFLIKNIELLDNHGTRSGLPLKEASIQLLHIPAEIKDCEIDIYCSLLGLLIDTCSTAWKTKQPVALTKNIFANLRHIEIRKAKLKSFVEQPFFQTKFQEHLSKDNKDHLFIRQLSSIGMKVEGCNDALRDYWAFYSERVRLQKLGEVSPSDWDARNDMIYNRWVQLKNLAELDLDETASKTKFFRDVYKGTMDANYKASLGEYQTEHGYFTAGNYHDLANSPHQHTFIHWHNDFKSFKE